jgi:penicillin amidase
LSRPGDGETVNATGYDESPQSDSWQQIEGASYREILDVGDWDRSVAVNSPGQSGQPGSRHYDDLLPLWDAGKYFPLAYSRDAVESATVDRLLLRP